MKKCPRCGESKKAAGFYKNKRNKNGLSDWCKTCHSEYNKQYRQEEKGRLAISKAVKKYQQTEKGKAAFARAAKKYNSNIAKRRKEISEHAKTTMRSRNTRLPGV